SHARAAWKGRRSPLRALSATLRQPMNPHRRSWQQQSFQNPFKTSLIASDARTLQWIFDGGNPPSASAICSFVLRRASPALIPIIISVAYELVAIAALQPCALNLAS